MKPIKLLKRLRRDNAGSTIIEFAVLAPALIAMLLGIFQIGMQMQNYNALRSLASDVSRFTVVQYQNANTMSDAQIRDVAAATAVEPPYLLAGDRLDVSVVEEATPVAGARRFNITMTYYPNNWLGFFKIDALTLTHQQSIYVPA